jgi:hypothetical protein
MTPPGKLRVANPIAVRSLSVAGEPGREIVITIGKPRPEPDPSVWRCSFLVDGIPKARRRVAYGVDSLQAVQNAVEGARRVLQASGLACTWHGGLPGEIGLPRAIPSYEGSGLAEKIERYIERELKKFLRRAKARGLAGRAARPGSAESEP